MLYLDNKIMSKCVILDNKVTLSEFTLSDAQRRLCASDPSDLHPKADFNVHFCFILNFQGFNIKSYFSSKISLDIKHL